MQHNFSVFREGDAMHKGLEQLKVIRERLKNARRRYLQRVQHPAR